MNELKEDIEAIKLDEADELLPVVLGIGWRTFLKVLLPLLPVILVCALCPVAIAANISFEELSQRFGLDFLKDPLVQVSVENIVSAPFATIVMMTATVATVRAIAQRQRGCWADFSTAMRRLLPLIGTFSILLLLVAALTAVQVAAAGISEQVFSFVKAAAFVVTIIFAVKFAFVMHSVVLDGTWGLESFRESVRLTKDRWWQTAGTLVVVSFVALAFQIPANAVWLVADRIVDMTGSGLADIIAGIVTTAIGFAAGVFLYAVVTAMYLMRRGKGPGGVRANDASTELQRPADDDERQTESGE